MYRAREGHSVLATPSYTPTRPDTPSPVSGINFSVQEDTEITNYDVGEEALDRVAIAIGGKTMVPVLFERISELIKSTEWKHRHAALMAISQSGEGCQAQMARQLEQIVGMIVQVLGD